MTLVDTPVVENLRKIMVHNEGSPDRPQTPSDIATLQVCYLLLYFVTNFLV